MLESSDVSGPPILARRRLKKAVYQPEEDSATYLHTCLSPVIYMGVGIMSWAAQLCSPCVNTCSTIETTEEVINFFNKNSFSQLLTAAPSSNNHLKEMRGLPYMLHFYICCN
jgi:hypothetical protein